MGLFATKQEKLNKRMFKAIRARSLEKLQAALDEGADVNAYDEKYDMSPLYSAVTRVFEPAVLLLLVKKADPDFARSSGHSCLMEAAYDGSYRIAVELLDAGAQLETKDKPYGRTALHNAALRGRGDVARMLIQRGANVAATDNRMNTPADLADKDHPRVADMIRGKTRAEEEAPAASAAGTEGWHLTAPDEVCNVSIRAGIGYRLTEIFNFTSQTYTRIAQNTASGQESQSLKFFDEFKDAAVLGRARAALAQLGGRAVEQTGALNKPVMAAPQTMPKGSL
jgi:hypothetical protein